MRVLYVAMMLAGCATAAKQTLGERPDGGLPNGNDSNGMVWMDAPADQSVTQYMDAPQMNGPRTLSETTGSTVTANNSIACGSATGTAQNSYYRLFTLSDFGITTDFVVSQVSFQTEYVSSAPAGKVTIGTYSGTAGGSTIAQASITAVMTATGVAIPNADADDTGGSGPGKVDVPIAGTIPAGSILAVRLDVPSSSGFFYIGTSSAGESKPGYISTTSTQAGCNPPGNTPTSMTTLAPTAAAILMTVTGTPM